MNFNEAVCIIYTKCEGILTVGVKLAAHGTQKQDVLLNPAKYTLTNGDSLLVICNDQESADLISNYDSNDGHFHDNYSPSRQMTLTHMFENVRIKANSFTCELSETNVDLIMDDLSGKLKNHVIVFGNLEEFELLLKTIRVYSEQPVCFFSEKDPDVRWEKISKNPNVFYLQGNMHNFQDLYYSGISDCYCAVILSSSSQNPQSPDSDIVLLSRIIEMSFPHVRFISELMDESFMRFMGSRPFGNYQNLPYHFWPKYISGKVYFTSYLETLICQSYYNPDLCDILMKMMGITKSRDEMLKYEENSIIKTITLPVNYFKNKESCPWEELFIDLIHLSPPVIGLGIYSDRYTRDGNETESELKLMNTVDHECVFTNPSPSMLVYKDDRIIVIGETLGKFQGENTENVQAPSHDELLNLGLANLLLKNKQKEPEDAIDEEEKQEDQAIGEIMSILGKLLEPGARLQRKIELKTRMIQDLYRESETMKEELMKKHKMKER